MTVLSAALAFAITMLILSMVNSVFVETVHRVASLRETGLNLLMSQIYDRVMTPILAARGLPDTMVAALRQGFVDLMTVNRAPAGDRGMQGLDLSSDSTKIDEGLWSKWWKGRRLAKLGVDDFMSRLGGSEFGDHVRDAIRASDANVDEVLKDIAERFEQFGRESSVFFERRARLVSVLCAVALALVMFIHPLELYRTFMANPEVTARVIAIQDATLAAYDQQREQLTTQMDAASASANPAAVEEARKALQDLQDKIAAETSRLQGLGVPIGWSDERLASIGLSHGATGYLWVGGKFWTLLPTLLWLALGGLLVGLGSPFWYDLVKSVSMIRTLVGGPKSATNTGAQAATPGTGEDKQPQTPVEHFKTAAEGRNVIMDGADAEDQPVG